MDNPNNNRQGQIPNYPQQYQMPQAADSGKHGPSKGELFLGLNVLSKIGVIFIIIGVIAFAAVSKRYLAPVMSTVVVLAVGVIMAGAGELFYRIGSHIFARALTLGGIIDWAVSVLVSYYSFEAINVIAAIGIGTGAALAAMTLAYRYNSQTVMVFAAISAFLPFFAAVDRKAGFFASLMYLLVVQGAAVIVSAHKRWQAVIATCIACNFFMVILVMVGCWSYIASFSAYTATVIAVLYVLLSFGIYTAYSLVHVKEVRGKLSSDSTAVLILSQVLTIIFTLLFMIFGTDRTSAGVAMLTLTAIYIGLAAAFSAFCGKSSKVVMCLENLLLSSAVLTIFTLIQGRYAYIVFHVLAAALLIYGFLRDRRMFRIWGYATLSAAEFYFFIFCWSMNGAEKIFVWQFALNSAIWIGLMILYIVKKKSSVLLSVYSSAVMLNTGIFASYILSAKLLGTLLRAGAVSLEGRPLFSAAFSAAAWLLLGFAASKLKHMKKSAAGLSLSLYIIGMLFLLGANICNATAAESTVPAIILTVALNVVSVLAALDMALQIKAFAPKFSRAVGLTVSAYALYAMTITLGSNKWVAFTSCIISIVYLAAAALWITFGFRKKNALMRRFGLVLALLSAAKLFLFDFRGLNAMGRTLMFIGFGVALLCISFAYGFFSKRLKNKH